MNDFDIRGRSAGDSENVTSAFPSFIVSVPLPHIHMNMNMVWYPGSAVF